MLEVATIYVSVKGRNRLLCNSTVLLRLNSCSAKLPSRVGLIHVHTVKMHEYLISLHSS